MSIYSNTKGDRIIYPETKDFNGQSDVIARTDGEYHITTKHMDDLKQFFLIEVKTPTQQKRYLYSDKEEACLAHLHYVNCVVKYGDELDKYPEPVFVKAVFLKN
jgi:hypothetical protein